MIVMAIALAVVLPLTAIMYIDMLAVRSIVKEELTKVVKARREMERDRHTTTNKKDEE